MASAALANWREYTLVLPASRIFLAPSKVFQVHGSSAGAGEVFLSGTAAYLNPDDFVIAIDDTDNPKYGKRIYGCGTWVTKHSAYFGQKILLLALVDMNRKIAIPLNYAFKYNRGHPEHENVLSKIVNLLDEHLPEHWTKLTVVADSWFDFARLRNDCICRGITLVT